MPTRNRTRERIACLLIVTFALLCVQGGQVSVRPCAGQCPVDCPMHAKAKCHHGGAPAPGAPPHDCHHSTRLGLSPTGCSHAPQSVSAGSVRALLPDAIGAAPMPSFVAASVLSRSPAVRCADPPDHPPPISAFV